LALNAAIHWGLILRVNVPQAVTQDGWKYLLANARYPFNFDGEIFGLHSSMGDQLRIFGFRGDEAGQEADFVDVDRGFNQASTAVNWLERVDVIPLGSVDVHRKRMMVAAIATKVVSRMLWKFPDGALRACD